MSVKKFIAKLLSKIKSFFKSASRKFDISLALRRKKDPENPLLRVNVKGEIPKPIVAFCAIVGVFTILSFLFKIIRIFKK